MKSGLEGRNNQGGCGQSVQGARVSMKSGLEGRNNQPMTSLRDTPASCLNEVRPRRPEQCGKNIKKLRLGTMSQ